MSEGLYRIKPLEWERIAGSHAIEEYYEAVENSWANKGYAVCTRSRRWHYWSIPKNSWLPCDSLEAGKAACEAHWMQMLEKIFEPVDIDLEYRRHVEELRKLVGRRSGAEEMAVPKLPAGGPKEGK